MRDRLTVSRAVAVLSWVALAGVVTTPVLIAASSPLLAGRDAAYIAGGMAGVIALAVLMFQPLLAAGYLPGIPMIHGQRWHRWMGTVLVMAVSIHIAGLYLSSPADMIDALMLVAPTLYSLFGVIGMWGLVLIVLLLAGRSRLRLRAALWRMIHNVLAVVVVVASVVHAVMIDGAMGEASKLVLCVGVLAATVVVSVNLRFRQVARR